MHSLATRVGYAVALSAAVSLGLAGCSLAPHAPPQPRAGETAAAAPPAAPRASLAAASFPIDSVESELRILVFRAGALARMGHDHVIEGHRLSGWIDPNARGSQQIVDLVIPADAFEIDPDAARGEEGPTFAEPITADAKAGTRHNMLGEALLDAAHFPHIEVRGIAADVADSTTVSIPEKDVVTEPPRAATLTVAVAGHESRQTVEITEVRSANQLIFSADFSLRQSALGLTPFSVMMGALQVQDEMHLRVRIVARRIQSAAGSPVIRIAVPSGAM
jgi:hypothetical protein